MLVRNAHLVAISHDFFAFQQKVEQFFGLLQGIPGAPSPTTQGPRAPGCPPTPPFTGRVLGGRARQRRADPIPHGRSKGRAASMPIEATSLTRTRASARLSASASAERQSKDQDGDGPTAAVFFWQLNNRRPADS